MKTFDLKGLVFLSLIVLSLAACSSPEKKAANHLQKGEDYFKSSQYVEASLEFKNAIKFNGKDAKGHYDLGLAYYSMGGISNLRLAFQEFNRAVSLDQNLASAQLKIGELYLLSHEFDKAREKAEIVLNKDKGNIDARVLLASIVASKSGAKKALPMMEEVLKSNPGTIRPYIIAAGMYLSLKDRSSAEKTFRQALEVKKDALEPRYALASLYVSEGRRVEAENELKKAVELNPGDQGALANLANFYASAGRFAEAEKAYQAAVDLKPENPNGYLLFSRFYLATKRAQNAQDILKKGIDRNPDAKILRASLAELLLGQNNFKDAAVYIDGILKKEPKDPGALYLRSRVRLAENKSDEAIEDLELAVKGEPDSPLFHYYLGAAYRAKGNIETAKSEFGTALKIAPGYMDARLALASMQM